jgi:hypothetical protein
MSAIDFANKLGDKLKAHRAHRTGDRVKQLTDIRRVNCIRTSDPTVFEKLKCEFCIQGGKMYKQTYKGDYRELIVTERSPKYKFYSFLSENGRKICLSPSKLDMLELIEEATELPSEDTPSAHTNVNVSDLLHTPD